MTALEIALGVCVTRAPYRDVQSGLGLLGL